MQNYNEISPLVAYFGGAPTQSTITKSNDIVSAVSVIDSLWGGTITSADFGADEILHDGTTAVGSLLAFNDTGAGAGGGLRLDFESPAHSMPVENGVTIVWAEQRNTTGSGLYSFQFIGSAGNGTQMFISRSGTQYNVHQCRTNFEVSTITTNPRVFVLTCQGTANSTQLWIDGQEIALGDHAAPVGFYEKLMFMNAELSGSGSLNGKIGLGVVYGRGVTDQEAADLTTLTQTWIDTGEAPGVPGTAPTVAVTPSSSTVIAPAGTSYSAAVTGDPAPTTTWQYEALGDTGNWQDATVLSGVSNSTGPTLEIASTVNGESGTVRASTTNSEGTATGTAVLVVEDEVVIPPGASGSMSCTAKHPYAQFQWFGKKTTGTEWEPVEDVWPGKTTVSTVDNVSTISWAGVVDTDAGQAFCRIGNPLYVVATGPVTPGDGDGYSYVDSDIASIAVGALEFTLQPQDVTVEETALPGTLSPKLNGRPPLDNTRHLQHCAELCRR